MSAPELEIRISADIAELKTALNAIQGDLGKLTTRAQDAGAKAAAGMEKFRNATSRAITVVKSLFAALAGAVVVRSIISAADQMQNLASRLSLVTRNTDELAAAQEGVFEIAQRTRSGLAETADLYFRIANSGKELGLSQERVLRLTESINKAVQISGVSAEAANAGLIQFSQGLASGALRGDELRSVLEQIPGLADAIAAGMGVSRTKLRELGEQGKLTAEAILGALEKQGEVLDDKFAKFPITVGGAMTKVRNSVLKLIGDLSKSTGVVRDLANSISGFADFLSSPEFLGKAIEWVTVLVEGFKSIGDSFSETTEFIRNTWPDLLSDGESFVGALVRILGQIPINIKTAVQLVVVEIAATFDKLLVNARLVWNSVKAIFADTTIAGAAAIARAEIDAIERARDATIQDILAERERVLQAGKKAREDAEKARNVKPSTDAAGGVPRGTSVGLVVDDLKLLKDATERAIQDVENLYDDAKISAQDYLERRKNLQLGLIEAEIAAERRRVAEGGKGASDALTNIVILERQKTAVMAEAERERTSIAEEYAARRLELTIANLEATGQKAEAKRLELEAEWSETLARMKAEGDEAGVALIESLINREVLDAKLAEITGAFDEAVERLQATEQSIANQVQAGAITQTQGEREIQAVRAKSITQLRAYIAALEDLYATTGDERILAVIDDYKNKLADAERVTNTFGAKVRDAFENSLKGFFSDIITATSSVEDAFKNMARAFAAAVADMIAQALAAQVVRTLLASFGGGTGAAVAHTGGVINNPVANRKVNPAVFLGAPRYHAGGVAGLKPGEVPAILQQGEEVLTRDDPRHQANGGTGGGEAGGAGIRIVNVLDPALITDALGGAQGERAIMNVIQRNAGGISRLLAR